MTVFTGIRTAIFALVFALGCAGEDAPGPVPQFPIPGANDLDGDPSSTSDSGAEAGSESSSVGGGGKGDAEGDSEPDVTENPDGNTGKKTVSLVSRTRRCLGKEMRFCPMETEGQRGGSGRGWLSGRFGWGVH